jgi:hypothetical protein
MKSNIMLNGVAASAGTEVQSPVSRRPERHTFSHIGCLLFLLLATHGCVLSDTTLPTKGLQHESPQDMMASLCRAMQERDYDQLIELADPSIRTEWAHAIRWTQKCAELTDDISSSVRESPPDWVRLSSDNDIILRLRDEFCHKALSFELLNGTTCTVFSEGASVPLYLRHTGGTWYLLLYDNPEEAQYMCSLVAEMAKHRYRNLQAVGRAEDEE